MSSDSFDPNNWETDDLHEYRIYGDDNAQTWCVVSPEDYQWAIQWRWHINKPHPRRNGAKKYFCRQTSNGRRPGQGKLLLHIEIMRRIGIKPSSSKHTLVEHIDGNEHNCRRENLEWTTALRNRRTSKQRGAFGRDGMTYQGKLAQLTGN